MMKTVQRLRATVQAVLGFVTVAALIVLAVDMFLSAFLPPKEWIREIHGLAGGVFSVSALLYFVVGGHETLVETDRVRTGHKPTPAAGVAIAVMWLWSLALFANLVESVFEMGGQRWWVMFRNALGAVLVGLALLYVVLRYTVGRRLKVGGSIGRDPQ